MTENGSNMLAIRFFDQRVFVRALDDASSDLLARGFCDFESALVDMDSDETPNATLSRTSVDWNLTSTVDGSIWNETTEAGALCRLDEILTFVVAGGVHHAIAIHAGAVCDDEGNTIIMVGESGAGKSTLVSLMLARGWRYLTDELVVIEENGTVHGWPRLIHLKGGAREVIAEQSSVDATHPRWFRGEHVDLVAPEAVAAKVVREGELRAIVFPRFERNAPTTTIKLRGIDAATNMTQQLVNARNLPKLGLPSLVALCRKTPAWAFAYSEHEAVDSLLSAIMSEWAS
ncbi:MAG: hypothetical protein R3A47_12180 [Polyangiales bacterium]